MNKVVTYTLTIIRHYISPELTLVNELPGRCAIGPPGITVTSCEHNHKQQCVIGAATQPELIARGYWSATA